MLTTREKLELALGAVPPFLGALWGANQMRTDAAWAVAFLVLLPTLTVAEIVLLDRLGAALRGARALWRGRAMRGTAPVPRA